MSMTLRPTANSKRAKRRKITNSRRKLASISTTPMPESTIVEALTGGETTAISSDSENSTESMASLEECADLLDRNTASGLRRAQVVGQRLSTGSKKAQRRCNDLMIGGNSERIKVVWSIDQIGLPPVAWTDHLILGLCLVGILVYAFVRFINEWNQWLRPPRTDKSKNYTPLTMLKPARLSMVKIVACEDQSVLTIKPTRKMVEVARLRDQRAQQLRAHYSEPTRLASDNSSIAAALLTTSRQSTGGQIPGAPSHAKTIACSLARYATAPSNESPENRSPGPNNKAYAPPRNLPGVTSVESTGIVMRPAGQRSNWQTSPPGQHWFLDGPAEYLKTSGIIPSVIVDSASPPHTQLNHGALFASQTSNSPQGSKITVQQQHSSSTTISSTGSWQTSR